MNKTLMCCGYDLDFVAAGRAEESGNIVELWHCKQCGTVYSFDTVTCELSEYEEMED